MSEKDKPLRDALEMKASGAVAHYNSTTFAGANKQGLQQVQNYGGHTMTFGGSGK
jgi:hypothetical protein